MNADGAKQENTARDVENNSATHDDEEKTSQSSHNGRKNEGGGGTTDELQGSGPHIQDGQLPYLGVLTAATVLLVALIVNERDADIYVYGLVVADVAIFFAIFGYINQFFTQKSRVNGMLDKITAYFLAVWCFVGACVLTFRAPFESTGNGYFASWVMAIASIMATGVSGADFKSAMSGMHGSLTGLAAAAIVVIFDVVEHLDDGQYGGEAIFAFIASCLTLVVVAISYFLLHARGLDSQYCLAVFVFFAVLWIVLAGVVTFRGPFKYTGNGYFGAWGGAVLSVYTAKSARHLESTS